MYHIANVNADFKLDASIGRDIGVAFGQRSLNFNRALRCFQRAPELDQERVTDRFYFRAVKPRKDFPKQPAMFLQQFLGKLFVPLAQRAVTHHVGEHDGGQLALLVSAHFSVTVFPNSRPGIIFSASASNRGSPRSGSSSGSTLIQPTSEPARS